MRTALLLVSMKGMSDSYAPKVSGSYHARCASLAQSLSRFCTHNILLTRRGNEIHPLGSSSRLFGGEGNLESMASWACDSPESKITGLDEVRTEPFRVEMVDTKRRLLDVKVFRGLSMTPEEFILKLNYPRESCHTSDATSEEDAVNLLMQDYDERGRYIKFRSVTTNYEQEVYFVAVYSFDHDTIQNFEADGGAKTEAMMLERTNGVIGVVSAQQRGCSPFTVDTSIGDTDQQTANLEVHIPFPHIYLANMRVHQAFRRMGIGRTLLSSVVDYARTFSHEKHNQMRNNLPIVLSVDNDNCGAVSTYEAFGFEYMGKNDIFGSMVFWT